MDCITVTTQEELKRAIKEKSDKIIVVGELAKKVKKAEVIKKLSPVALSTVGVLGLLGSAGIAAAPATGGASLAFFATQIIVTTATAKVVIPISVLALISGVGIVAMSILFDEYSHVEISREKIVFERKRKKRKRK